MAWSKNQIQKKGEEIILKCENIFRKLLGLPEKKLLQQLPRVTHPIDQAIQKSQANLFLTFIMAGIFCATYTYISVHKYNRAHDMIEVYVAQEDLVSPQEIKKEFFQKVLVPRGILPERTVKDLKDLQEKVLVENVYKNEVLTLNHLKQDVHPESVSGKFNNHFVFTVDENWFDARFPKLKRNDVIDVLVQNMASETRQTSVVASNVRVIELQEEKGKRSLLLNVEMKDVESILFARGLRLPLQILLHPAG